jgi:hypothetical protein
VEYVALWKKSVGGLKSYEVVMKIKELLQKYSLSELE